MSVDLLVDTHVLIWMALDDQRWERMIGGVVDDNASTVSVSAVSWTEIAVKGALGKLDVDLSALRSLAREHGFLELDLTGGHAEQLAQLPLHHRDPFDRMLIAQAMAEEMVIATVDSSFARYDGLRIHEPGA